ncbi:MAG: hypothetical protein CVT49_12715 [candidate division Zixibacteria bacterium HGW-Zixibacteria-1]|nr:MAG: hypothetical protein CVT49_12715 [candidate division Zixibacteria bacterium HGW-Zixibacteria-1]
MELYFLNEIGKTFGIGGLCIAVFLLIIRLIFRKMKFPKLTREHTYRIIDKSIRYAFILAIVGLVIYSGNIMDRFSGKSIKAENTTQSFRLTGFFNQKLVNNVIKLTGIPYTSTGSATFDISFTQNGLLRPSQKSGYYLYDGGTLLLVINNKIKCEISQLTIPAWSDSPGNPKAILEHNIEQNINDLIASNIELIAARIKECLDNESKI